MNDIQLPYAFLQCDLQTPHQPPDKATISAPGLTLTQKNLTMPLHVKQTNDKAIALFGTPTINDTINRETICEAICNQKDDLAFYRSINGEFLIVVFYVNQKILKIVTDRFVSIPFYYATVQNVFVGSPFYNDLWLWHKKNNTLTFNQTAFFEFLWLQRLLGTTTYDTASHFMPAASILTYDQSGIHLESYWSPSFAKTKQTLKDTATDLAEALKTSAKRKTSDGIEKKGLFLSGGRDSRSILAAFESPPTCFTISVSQNNEFRIAQDVARRQNAEHVFLQLNPDPYSEFLDQMVQIGGGMYAYDHAIFIGFKHLVAPKADVIFHGHGLDYMFQGMYVPKNRISLGNRKTSFYTLRTLSNDLITDFLQNISYRLKGINLLNYIKKNKREQMYESLRHSVQKVIDNGEACSNSPYDQWEYLLMHALSRHYPRTNIDSMGICAEPRTLTFDNDVFNIYLSLPPKYRLNARIAIQTLKNLSPELAQLPTGNTNFRADLSPFQIEMHRGWDSILRKLHIRKRTHFWTPAEERTWPDRDKIYCSQPQLKQYALDLCHSDALRALNFLDFDALSNQIPEWVDKPSGGGAFLSFLITLDRFLKQ